MRNGRKVGGSIGLLSVWALLVAVLLLPGGNVAFGYESLDEYNLPTSPLQNVVLVGSQPSGTTASSGVAIVPSSEVIGGNRYISLTIGATGLGAGKIAQALVSVGPGEDRYTFQLPDNTQGSGNVIYSGTTTAAGCSLNANLTGYNKFTTFITGVDHPITLTYTVWNNTCTSSATYNLSLAKDDIGAKDVYFSSFSNPALFSANIGRLSISWSASSTESESLDMSWDYLRADCDVPAPVITSFTADTPVPYGSAQTFVYWNWNYLTNPVHTALITNDCGATPANFSVASTSGSQLFSNLTFPCHFTFTADGLCEDTSRSITITQAPPPGKVPSLNEWGMIILSLILAGSAIWMLRRKRTGR